MFSYAELFLMAWASVATVLAVYYHTRLKQAGTSLHISHRILVGLMLGEVQMKKIKGGVRFTNERTDEDEISIEIREG